MTDLDNVTHRRFCGIPVGEYQGAVVICQNEAIGDLTAELEDGSVVEVPICGRCADRLNANGRVEGLDSLPASMV